MTMTKSQTIALQWQFPSAEDQEHRLYYRLVRSYRRENPNAQPLNFFYYKALMRNMVTGHPFFRETITKPK